jgi:hypothetical protein
MAGGGGWRGKTGEGRKKRADFQVGFEFFFLLAPFATLPMSVPGATFDKYFTCSALLLNSPLIHLQLNLKKMQ